MKMNKISSYYKNIIVVICMIVISSCSVKSEVSKTQDQGVGILQSTNVKKLCIYYGWPSSFDNASNINEAIRKFSNYNIIVFGDTLENPSHDDYENTKQIISELKKLNSSIEIFGYIALGNLTYPSDKTIINDKLEKWNILGVTGIFYDEFGYDYDVTRELQNYAVNSAHLLNKNVIANSWQPEWVYSNSDIVYKNFHGNLDGVANVMNEKDYYLLEHLIYEATTDSKMKSKDNYMERITNTKQYTENILVADTHIHSSNEELRGMYNTAITIAKSNDIKGYCFAYYMWGASGFAPYDVDYFLPID